MASKKPKSGKGERRKAKVSQCFSEKAFVVCIGTRPENTPYVMLEPVDADGARAYTKRTFDHITDAKAVRDFVNNDGQGKRAWVGRVTMNIVPLNPKRKAK